MRELQELYKLRDRVRVVQPGYVRQGDVSEIASLLADVVQILIDIEEREDSPARTGIEGDRDG